MDVPYLTGSLTGLSLGRQPARPRAVRPKTNRPKRMTTAGEGSRSMVRRTSGSSVGWEEESEEEESWSSSSVERLALSRPQPSAERPVTRSMRSNGARGHLSDASSSTNEPRRHRSGTMSSSESSGRGRISLDRSRGRSMSPQAESGPSPRFVAARMGHFGAIAEHRRRLKSGPLREAGESRVGQPKLLPAKREEPAPRSEREG